MPKELRNSRMLVACILDNRGRILFYNELLGGMINPHTASHLHYSEFLHPEDLENFRSGLSIALSGRTTSGITARIPVPKPGVDHFIVWELIPVEDPLNKEQFVLGIGSQQHQANMYKVIESPDSEMIQNLLTRNRDLEQFANIVSHNIRSPLANIMGLNKLLGLKLSESDRDMALNGIRVSAEKLETVIKDLNDVLQVRTKGSSNEDIIELRAIADDIGLSIADIISEKHVTITCDFEDAPRVKAVRSYVQSIFYNLITNSIKYAKPGVPPNIRITSSRSGNNILICFTDNGTGIDLVKHGSNLFGLYKRFNDKVEGKGLGLHMVKVQVEAMGGTIEAESKPGEGISFTVTLPDHS